MRKVVIQSYQSSERLNQIICVFFWLLSGIVLPLFKVRHLLFLLHLTAVLIFFNLYKLFFKKAIISTEVVSLKNIYFLECFHFN